MRVVERCCGWKMLWLLDDDKERRKEKSGGRRRGFIYSGILSTAV